VHPCSPLWGSIRDRRPLASRYPLGLMVGTQLREIKFVIGEKAHLLDGKVGRVTTRRHWAHIFTHPVPQLTMHPRAAPDQLIEDRTDQQCQPDHNRNNIALFATEADKRFEDRQYHRP
jgi:hypothetical protein